MNNAITRRTKWLLVSSVVLLFVSATRVEAAAGVGPLGYVGPGAGLGMLGALLAVVSLILLGLLAPFVYSVRLLRKWLRSRKDHVPGEEGESASEDRSPVGPDAAA